MSCEAFEPVALFRRSSQGPRAKSAIQRHDCETCINESRFVGVVSTDSI